MTSAEDQRPGSLTDQAGIVTGAGRGIGRAIALTLAGEGASLLLNDINGETLSETVELAKAANGRVCAVPGDVSDVDLVRSLPEQASAEFGRLDFLVNNAAAFRPSHFLDLDAADFDEVFAVNLRAMFLLSQATARMWVDQRREGRIVNLSSVSASFAQPRQAHYAASKAAIERMSRNIALELAPHAIRVNCIAPGGPILSEYVKERLQQPEYAAYGALRPPIGRFGDPREVAKAALFLICDDSSYVTGTVVTVDGGLTLGRSYSHGPESPEV